jgi:hypothetical protein
MEPEGAKVDSLTDARRDTSHGDAMSDDQGILQSGTTAPAFSQAIGAPVATAAAFSSSPAGVPA